MGGRDVDTGKVGYNLSCGAIGMNTLSKLLKVGFFFVCILVRRPMYMYRYTNGNQLLCNY